jgi:hypothetical protein
MRKNRIFQAGVKKSVIYGDFNLKIRQYSGMILLLKTK